MYVCNCNGITDSEVEEALRAGARKWDDVHAYFDCAPCCGQCECELTRAIANGPKEPVCEPAAEPAVFPVPGLALAG